jgi:uncharacterized membrane protein YjgN (DUF898 family)
MTKAKVRFTGSFWDFFVRFVGLVVLTVLTFGLLAPYLAFWQMKYFVTHLEIEMQ